MILFPNAKINLGLAVTEKRTDGFHNIESVFIPINLCDVLEIIPSNEFKLKTYGLDIDGEDEQNLCYKAYQLLKNDFNIPPVHIHLFKNIPMGAGMGGGSSNATFTLIALNKIFNLKLTNEKLSVFAEQLGSDCVFFIRNLSCFATKKGNIINHVNISLNDYYISILKSKVHISTAEAYRNINPRKPNVSFSKIVEEMPVETWKNYLYNDFEKQAFSKHPILLEYKNMMYQKGALYAGMTGSGSAIFGIFKEKTEFDIENTFVWSGKL